MSKKSVSHVRAVTDGPKHHFFGYYDKHQWDSSGRYLLAQEVSFADRPPTAQDELTIGIIDTEDSFRFEPIAVSRAWCWQQGCMLQWLPGSTDEIVYNDRIGDRFVSVILNVRTGKRRVLPRPIYTVNSDGQQALSLNFSRLAATRPGYGYPGLPDIWHDVNSPDEDGIYMMDIHTGDHKLLFSLDDIGSTSGPMEPPRNAKQWVNHLLFNPAGNRFVFLHRWPEGQGFCTRLCIGGIDGSIFVSSLRRGSHFIWKDNSTVLIWGQHPVQGWGYFLVEDRTDQISQVGKGKLTRDGHCTFSNDRRWILTDEYPGDDNHRVLILYDVENERRIDLGRFFSPPEYTGELRCDLHPRWRRDNKMICFDSLHEGTRQIYTMSVEEFVI